jgi:hypothetical protein
MKDERLKALRAELRAAYEAMTLRMRERLNPYLTTIGGETYIHADIAKRALDEHLAMKTEVELLALELCGASDETIERRCREFIARLARIGTNA